MKYVIVDGKPVPAKLGPEIQAIRTATGISLTSCERTQKAVDYARSQGYEVSSQDELYYGYIHGLPGYNPANPTGYSTHERRSDGVAYAVPRGMPLFYWQVGQDWGSFAGASKVCAEARKRGWVATITYPNQSNELHHVNFRKEPILVLFKPLKKGSKGLRVSNLTRKLAYITRKNDKDHTYLASKSNVFDGLVEQGVKDFQADHALKPDGVVGIHTSKQIQVSYRYQKKQDEINDLIDRLRETEAKLTLVREDKRKLEAEIDKAQDAASKKALNKKYSQVNQRLHQLQQEAIDVRDKIVNLGGDPSKSE